QLSKLIYGSDQGWRGGIELSGMAHGTPESLKLAVDGTLDNLGRQEVLGGGDLRLAAHCAAVYSSVQKTLANVDCVAPAGGGLLELKGGATPSASSRLFSSYRLWLVASKVDAESALRVARQAFAFSPDDLVASGRLNATIQASRDDSSQRTLVRGQGTVQQLELRSESSHSSIALGTLPFELLFPASLPVKTSQTATGRRYPRGKLQMGNATVAFDAESHLEVGPATFHLGGSLPLEARASLSRSGYEVFLRGAAELKSLLEAAQLLRIKGPAFAANGPLSVDLRMAGTWKAATWPKLLGTAHLRAVEAHVGGTNWPLAIVNATLLLGENTVKVQNLSAVAAETTWQGSMEFPRPCAAASACSFRFNLHTPELNARVLNDFLNPRLGKKDWYRFLSLGKEQPPYLLQARAAGKIAVDRLILGGAVGTRFSAGLRLEGGEVSLDNVRGQILGGTTSADWKANFLHSPPLFTGSGRFEGVALADVADLIQDRWIEGNGEAEYGFQATGASLDEVVSSAALTANFTVNDGLFPHIALTPDSGPLRAPGFHGNLRFEAGEFSFEDARLESPDGVYTVSGTALLDGTLDLKIAGPKSGGFNLTGTLAKTRVSPIQTAQASLKP
ncbi:MAG: hypothetical protein JO159_08165, partial [Acidobacteria bacterium]|nr:hypothetical protein [Acidobacteriota bacterium]